MKNRVIIYLTTALVIVVIVALTLGVMLNSSNSKLSNSQAELSTIQAQLSKTRSLLANNQNQVSSTPAKISTSPTTTTINTTTITTATMVGKWKDNTTQNTIEFTKDGYAVITDSSGNLVPGKYQLIGVDVVHFYDLAGFMPGPYTSVFGADTWQYKISKNTMTVKASGYNCILNRIASN